MRARVHIVASVRVWRAGARDSEHAQLRGAVGAVETNAGGAHGCDRGPPARPRVYTNTYSWAPQTGHGHTRLTSPTGGRGARSEPTGEYAQPHVCAHLPRVSGSPACSTWRACGYTFHACVDRGAGVRSRAAAAARARTAVTDESAAAAPGALARAASRDGHPQRVFAQKHAVTPSAVTAQTPPHLTERTAATHTAVQATTCRRTRETHVDNPAGSTAACAHTTANAPSVASAPRGSCVPPAPTTTSAKISRLRYLHAGTRGMHKADAPMRMWHTRRTAR